MMIHILPLVDFLFLMTVWTIGCTLVIHREGINPLCCGVMCCKVTSQRCDRMLLLLSQRLIVTTLGAYASCSIQ